MRLVSKEDEQVVAFALGGDNPVKSISESLRAAEIDFAACRPEKRSPPVVSRRAAPSLTNWNYLTGTKPTCRPIF